MQNQQQLRPSNSTTILETLATRGRTPLVRLPADPEALSVLEGMRAAGLVHIEGGMVRLTGPGRRLVQLQREESAVREDAGLPLSWDDAIRLEHRHSIDSGGGAWLGLWFLVAALALLGIVLYALK